MSELRDPSLLSRRTLCRLTLCLLVGWPASAAEDRAYSEAELVFPLNPQHNHAPGIVECPNGDLLVSWYRGSGERTADDVAVFGARQRNGELGLERAVSDGRHPGFPDCNTCMMIDRQDRLWLFWPTILANSWESCLTNYHGRAEYQGRGRRAVGLARRRSC